MKPGSLISRNSLFRHFLAASTISLLGNHIFDIAIPLYIVQRTRDPMVLSLANIALTLPFFLMAPLTGYTVDNYDKRRVMLASDLGQVACLIFLLIYEHLGQTNFIPILLVIFLAKTLMITFETVATFQLIPALVKDQDLGEANSWFLSAQRFIQIFGPLVAGLLMSSAGLDMCVFANMASFLATLYFVLRMKNLNELIEGDNPEKGQPRKRITVGRVIDSFLESVRYVWKSSLFRPFIIMMFVWNFSSLIPNTPSLVYYFTIEKHMSATQYGLIASIFGLAGILGYVFCGKLYRNNPFYQPFVFSGISSAITATIAIYFFDTPPLLVAIFSFSRIGASIVTMGTFFLRQTHIPKAQMGGINSALRMFFMASAPLSAFVQGFLIQHFSVKMSFIMGALCLWVTTWYSIKVAKIYAASKPSLQMKTKKVCAS